MASPTNTNSTSTLRGVINEVTKEKLTWLENQRDVLKGYYATVLKKYEEPEQKTSLKFLKEIHETLKKCPDGDNPAKSTTDDLSVFFNWIDTDDEDAAVYFGSTQLIQDWIKILITHINNQIEKCEYACLYANAMTQYMDTKGHDVPELAEEASVTTTSGEGGIKFKSTDGNKKETAAEFEKRVFTEAAPKDFKIEDFEELLRTKLFDEDNDAERKQFLGIKYDMGEFCKNFSRDNNIASSDIKNVIDGLVKEDLLGGEKNMTLRELQKNDDALQEVCTLLNKRLKNYSTWSWPSSVVVQFKRNVAGRYRAYMDEDILTAILLHYIGAQWSIKLKKVFLSIYSSNTWNRGTGTVGDSYYTTSRDSIETFRRKFHKESFLTVLPDELGDLEQSVTIYDEGTRRRTTTRGRKVELTPMQIKQRLLHIISNEIHLNNVLRPNEPLTIVQTDMEWFGPSLIHEVVLSVLRYFGVTKEWLGFFRKFLEAPLKLNSSTAPIQHRKRGSPISHQITALLGESLLFVMDLYVNRQSELSIYRIHDDFWFWDHRKENVMRAWNAMQTFTKLSGLTMNEEKSASVVCKSDLKDDPKTIIFGEEPLPQKNVQWGFIVLYSDGVFRISSELLAPHVQELKQHLAKADSVMSWIHGHNRYLHFFIRNFGEPARTFQRQHVVQIMKNVKDILKQIHPATKGDAVAALKQKFPEILKGKDVIESWVHWPVKSGGLALYNPFLELIPLHEAYKRNDAREKMLGFSKSRFAAAINQDKIKWASELERSKERRKKRSKFVDHSVEELEEETISDAEEYSHRDVPLDMEHKPVKRVTRVTFDQDCERYRETVWSHWKLYYTQLLENLCPIHSELCNNWTESLYSDQIEDRLGNGETEFVDDKLVPISLISAMQADRVHKN